MTETEVANKNLNKFILWTENLLKSEDKISDSVVEVESSTEDDFDWEAFLNEKPKQELDNEAELTQEPKYDLVKSDNLDVETPLLEKDEDEFVNTPAELHDSTDTDKDELSLSAIMSSIKNNPRVKVDNLNDITRILNNLYKAINIGNDISVIQLDSAFAIPHDLDAELPEGAIGWFFSEDQIENLSLEIDNAINLANNGEKLTDIQQVLVNLNSTGEVVVKTINELNENRSILKELIDKANE